MFQRVRRTLFGPSTAAASTNDESQPGPERERSSAPAPAPAPAPARTTSPGAPPPVLTNANATGTASAPGAPPPVLTNATGTASAPAHPLFDIKRIDKHLLSEWLNEWVGISPLRPFDADRYCNRREAQVASDQSAISFVLIDTRIFLALYHRYLVRRTFTLATILTTWHRRLVDLSAYDGALEQAVSRSQQNWYFIPRFNLVESDLNGWLQDAPTSLLLSRIVDRRLILSSFNGDRELPCTSITLNGGQQHHLLRLLAQDNCPVRLSTPARPDHPGAPAASRLAVRVQPVRQGPTVSSRFLARFALFLERAPNLTLWDFGAEFKPGSSTLLAFFRALPPLPHLRELDFTGRMSSADEASELATTLRRFPNMAKLNLEGSLAGVNGSFAVLSPSFEFLPQLTWLNLGMNKLGDEGCCALARALHHVPHLRWLYLSNNHIREEGCRALAASFRHVPRLRVLYLSRNEIGDEGCCAMAEEVHHLSCLQVLNINWNNVTRVGYSAMILALEHHDMVIYVKEGNMISGPTPPLPRFVRIPMRFF